VPLSANAPAITENVLLDTEDRTLAKLHLLRELGVQLAIDDFGTGYSSLSYLTRFPVDILKIDKSFVEQLTHRDDGLDGVDGSPSSDSAELARTIVHLGRSLRLGTVAEGIETREQYSALVSMACDYGQGFLFSRPLPAEGIDTLFAHMLVSTLPTPQVVYHATGMTA